jgi:PAS domain S-box-containing protein
MNGVMVVVLASAHIVRDGKDKPQRIDGTFTDFTGQKRMQDALKESEAKYRGLFENAQIGMYRSSLDGSAFLAVNNKFAEMMGFEREKLLGTPGRIRWADPDERGRVLSLLRERGGTLVNYETRVLTRDGDALDVVASIELHREAGYLEGTIADISERKRAERTLRASEAKYRTLVESIPQKIFMKDTNFRYVSINERFAHDLGIRPDEAVDFTRLYFEAEPIIRMDVIKGFVKLIGKNSMCHSSTYRFERH